MMKCSGVSILVINHVKISLILSLYDKNNLGIKGWSQIVFWWERANNILTLVTMFTDHLIEMLHDGIEVDFIAGSRFQHHHFMLFQSLPQTGIL